MNNGQEQIHKNNSQEDLDLKEILSYYLGYWKWFLLSCFLCGSLAYLYLRYATPEYEAYAKIMLVDENQASPSQVLLKDLELLSGLESEKIKDEIEVLKSRKLMANVVKSLGINVEIFKKGRIHDSELYPKAPIKLNFIESDSVIYESEFSFFINVKSPTEFVYYIDEEDTPKVKTFGENIITKIGGIIITPTINNIETLKGEPIQVKIKPLNKVAELYKEKIKITQADEFSKVLNITLKDRVRKKAIDVINELVYQYNKVSVDQKSEEAKKIANFINDRIDLIATDLSSIDQSAERFKTGNKLTDIVSEADMYLSSSSATEEELAKSQTELNLINFMKESVTQDQAQFEPIPSNVGLSDPSITNITEKYNELILERQRLLKSSNEKNPMVVKLDQELDGLKSSLSQSLNNLRNTIRIRVDNLKERTARINSKIYSVPGQERRLRDIQRQQQIKESLYLYLLEKREEATISLSSTAANAKVIDSAYSPLPGPVSPKPKMVYLAAIFIGLAIPFSVLYAKSLLDNKVHKKEDIEKRISNISVVGEIPHIKSKFTPLIEKNDRSVLSEAFRIARTNFDYLRKIRKREQYNNVLFVTSTVKGEGKTFFSMNMALTFANSNKRVLLIGADIRNPKIKEYLVSVKSEKLHHFGLTDYLFDDSLELYDVIRTYRIKNNNIDILLPGKTPPNPAELLMSDRMELMFNAVSQEYDVVIVDTAPTLLVTDTLLFSQFAGHTFYLVRAGFTEKKLLNYAKELNDSRKLNGMMLVLNDVKQANFGYGAKYGYGYGVEKKKKSLIPF